MNRVLGLFALAIAGFYLSYVLVLYVSQDQRIYLPQPGVAVPAPGFVFDRPGAIVRVSADERPGADAVIYFGGNAEDTSGALPQLRSAFPERSIYVMHYRSYQGSTGAPSESALIGDALALYDFVAAKSTHVRTIGRSLGSGIALQVAAQRPTEALVLITPYESFRRVVQELIPLVPVAWILRDRYESGQFAPRVRAPVILIAGAEDTLIPLAHARDLAQHFQPGQAVLHIAAGRGHSDVQHDPQFWSWMTEAPPDPLPAPASSASSPSHGGSGS